MASPFEIVMAEAMRQGKNNLSKKSINWFRQNVKTMVGRVNERDLMTEDGAKLINSAKSLVPGRLYQYYYDPKLKAELPYYDKFPLALYLGPSRERPTHFHCLNLHYLMPEARAHLLGALYDTLNNSNMNEKTKMMVTYGMLKSISRFRGFKPAYKEYIPSHVRSRFLKIPAADWTTAVFLPTERFEKANKQKVWRDSQDIIGGRTRLR